MEFISKEKFRKNINCCCDIIKKCVEKDCFLQMIEHLYDGAVDNV